MADFVFEIGTEELPARFQPSVESELRDKFTTGLQGAGLPFERLEVFGTPRRSVVYISGLAAQTALGEELVMGPPVRVAFDAEGKPTKAGEGFARTQGVDIAQAFKVNNEKGEYLAVRKQTGGESAMDFFTRFCPEVLNTLNFPKRMRWGSGSFSFARPLRWLLILLDDQIVPVEVGGVKSGRLTHGHRVHGPGPFELDTAVNYFELMRVKCQVIVSAAERRAMIVAQGNELAALAGGKVLWKDSLLDEVQGLCEHPVPLLGSFDPSFLEIPSEVLITSMEVHQKSFGLVRADTDPGDPAQPVLAGELMPHFLTVLNMRPKSEALVRKGWERVLRARLEDGRFFWKADLASGFDVWLDKLDKVIFLAQLGSMGDKTRRLSQLSGWLAERLLEQTGGHAAEGLVAADAARAGRLAKADLVSEMVGEFDTLQGVMGGIYALRKGESPAVAGALAEQYLPAGPDSPLPQSLGGAILSIADKADTLAGCFSLGHVPTGAADPFGLRRCALGIARIIEDRKLRLDVAEIFQKALDEYLEESLDSHNPMVGKYSPGKVLEDLKEFFALRLKNHFIAQGAETLFVEAILAAGSGDAWAAGARLAALRRFSARPDFGAAVLTFKRAANIIRKQGQEMELDGKFRADLLQEEAEKQLAASLEKLMPTFDKLWAEDRFDDLFDLLYELKPGVDNFFSKVMVMAEDKELRHNRLNLLQALVNCLRKLADFDALQM
ncbi:MAG: glycine--tRNA ligase subunit beta [Deltaproteobacteria bacterium]|jgi:glycyl-tRNA synthetase beta chain|nr:glycine--tRNA ligase subunit beta [Deltaproteobacteria bacterium]